MAEIEASDKTLTSTLPIAAQALPKAQVTKKLPKKLCDVRDTYNFTDDDVHSQKDDIDYINLVEWLFEDREDGPIVDIDAADVDDERAAVEYVKDIYSFYDFTENDGRVQDYMCSQTEINYESRAVLVDWLIKVHQELQLMPEVLYLAVNIFDRFLSVMIVPSRVLELVAITSILIACKYEHDQWAPRVSHFLAKAGNSYVVEEVFHMEEVILRKLEWCLSFPTPYVYLVRFIKASIPADHEEMENMTFFYAELGLTDYWTIISYIPSMLSASAVYAARCTLMRSPLWTETLKYYTGYSEDQLVVCARLLVGFHSSIGAGNYKQLEAVSKKYSSPERGAVALFPPARNLVSSWKNI